VHLSRLLILSLLIGLITLLPIGVVMSYLIYPESAIWQHLWAYVLPEIISNTAILLLGTGVVSAALGIALAWLTACHEFPLRRFFNWALILPLAMPAYVTAFVDIGLFDFTGPVQTFIRHHFGEGIWFPPIRSTPGVIMVMSLSLYPYVYLLCRNAFLSQGARITEAGQLLGLTRNKAFWRLALPMARPWIVGGVIVVLMETLADFGTMSVFNFDTFTTAIYKSWFGLFSLSAAAQLASLLVIVVFGLLIAEQYFAGRKRYHTPLKNMSPRFTLHGRTKWLALIFCSSILLFAFILPLLQLIYWSAQVFTQDFDERYPQFIWHTVLLASVSAGLVVAAALCLALTARTYPNRWFKAWGRLATLGYAVPGSVLAVGIFIPVAAADTYLINFFNAQFGWQGHSSFLRGTLFIMLLALMVRFMAPGFNSIETGLQRITKNQEDAAKGMGLFGWQLLRRIHLPLLKTSLFSAALLVFVDTMKEMPITLMTRPFGWDTLAVRVFEMTSEGQWDRAALPALGIVLVGLLPVFLLSRHQEN